MLAVGADRAVLDGHCKSARTYASGHIVKPTSIRKPKNIIAKIDLLTLVPSCLPYSHSNIITTSFQYDNRKSSNVERGRDAMRWRRKVDGEPKYKCTKDGGAEVVRQRDRYVFIRFLTVRFRAS